MVKALPACPWWLFLPLLGAWSQTAAASTPSGPTIASCDTVDCLLETISHDKSRIPSSAECKALDGRMDVVELKHDLERDLGPICRLLVARRAASRRATAPCTDRDKLNPDWDPPLEEKYSPGIENILLAQAPLERRGIKPPPAVAGYNNVTRFGTFVFDWWFGSGGKRISFATYLCIADSPRRYVPYYYMLSVDDVVVDAQVVAKPIDIPILRQVMNFKHEDDQPAFLLADLNGDRKQDLAVLRRHGLSNSYYPTACLYDAKGSDCVPVVASEPIVVEQMAPTLRLSAQRGTLIVNVFTPADKPIGEWRFRVTGRQLKMVARPDGAAAPVK